MLGLVSSAESRSCGSWKFELMETLSLLETDDSASGHKGRNTANLGRATHDGEGEGREDNENEEG